VVVRRRERRSPRRDVPFLEGEDRHVLPFFSAYAANYPVPAADLPELFLKYPRLMFVGSFEFPTTLWGWLRTCSSCCCS
jgi:hypothetical protein